MSLSLRFSDVEVRDTDKLTPAMRVVCRKITTPSGTRSDGIDFSAMDEFMTSTLAILTSEGSLIARVFPPEADVLLYFLERVANDVVSDYITSLLAAAQPLQHPLFLLATAATFGQVYRLVDKVLEIEPKNERVTKDRAEDVVFRMFEPLMDDYLQEEGEWIRQVLEGICEEWDRKVSISLRSRSWWTRAHTGHIADCPRLGRLGSDVPRLPESGASQAERSRGVHEGLAPPRHHHSQDGRVRAQRDHVRCDRRHRHVRLARESAQ